MAPNHVSHIDPLMIGLFLAEQGIAPRFLAKEGLFRTRFVGTLLTRSDQIPVHRGSSSTAESLARVEDAVRRGLPVVVYPEGTITRDPDGWPMTGRTGAVRVALATGAPLVPLAQWGAQGVLAPYAKRPHVWPRTPITIEVGDPIDLDDLRGRPIDEAVLREGTERLMARLTQMVADIRGELPSGPPLDWKTSRQQSSKEV